jgi:membrane fusion protein, copper/silver efflux system
MKENWKSKLFIVGVFSILLLVGGCEQKDSHTHAEGEVYTCPMHPQIVKNEPGSCPICGMDLVKKGGEVSNDTLSEDLAHLIRPTSASVVSTAGTTKPEKKELNVTLLSQGIVTYDTRRIYNIAARFGGRIEKLYVKYNYQPVRKGEKLYDIYSPELVTAQRELIYLLENDASNQAMIERARQKLSLLGLSANQIQSIENRKKADNTLSVYSPYNGYIVEEAALPAPPALIAQSTNPQGAMGGMNSQGSASNTPMNIISANPSGLSIQEGMYVSNGQTLFKVVNTDVVWAQFKAYPEDIASIRVGQPVSIKVEGDSSRTIKGKVDFIEPFYNEGALLPGFRVYLQNGKNELQIGNLLQGSIELAREGLWLPTSAVLDLGEKKVAFLKKGDTFSPVAVTTGQKTNEWIEIKSGLSEEDTLAANAQFMIDSESFIRVKSNE